MARMGKMGEISIPSYETSGKNTATMKQLGSKTCNSNDQNLIREITVIEVN